MRSKCCALLFFVFACVFWANQSEAAYQLNIYYIQHRSYEGGIDKNLIDFSITENGNPVFSDLVQGAKLTDPDGHVIDLKNLRFSIDRELEGFYNGDTGIWNYPDFFSETGGYYRAELEEDLISGKYALQVTLQNETVLTGFYDFKGYVELPVIPSHSIRPLRDLDGNMVFQWDIPVSISKNLPDTATSARVDFTVLDASVPTYFQIRVPSEVGMVFIPRDIANILLAEGNIFSVQVMLRTNDNCNRTYSSPERRARPIGSFWVVYNQEQMDFNRFLRQKESRLLKKIVNEARQ